VTARGTLPTGEGARSLAASDPVPYLDRLAKRIDRTRTMLCLGVDPTPDLIPPGGPGGLAGLVRLARSLVEIGAEYATALKFNLAFFEAYGSAGIAALERVRATVPHDVPVIADAKRGDIGSTAERHATALFDVLGADAVTASPYLGVDALEPLLARADRFVYVLCRTSNPGASELQDLAVEAGPDGVTPAEPLFVRVARRARVWNERFSTVGLVVGATAPDELRAVRTVAPELPFLVPGAGTQGGDVDATLRHGPATAGLAGTLRGGALLVNVSRSIAVAGRERDPDAAIARAARDWSQRLQC
jgi:orotidine-5'-phosphate decarboxylase